MASRGEELAEKEIEKLQSMEFDELIEAVDTGNNPFHEMELWERLDQKRERQEEISEESDKLLAELEEVDPGDVDNLREKMDKLEKLNSEMSELNEDLQKAIEVLPEGDAE